VPFCFPIFCENSDKKNKAIDFCNENLIETRPIISGNLLKQTCYKKYDDHTKFKNSDYLHKNAFYAGLHSKVTKENVIKLTNFLNNL
jgi:CDP-6-deoxy-D-xylo-4-hexulose-3-dehydrase